MNPSAGSSILRARGRRAVAGVALAAFAVTSVVALLWFVRPTDEPLTASDGLVSRIYDPPTRQVERLLIARDGQVYATTASDPLAAETDAIRGGPAEEAYRYQRPAYAWLGWVASGGGQAAAVPWALIGLTVLSVTLLVGATALALDRAGAPPVWALVVLITPGVMCNVIFVGPETLGTALVVLGLLRVRVAGGRATVGALALFAAAGLCRESLLLVPAVLALLALARRRPADGVRLALTAAPYVLWVLFLRVRVGALPGGTVDGRLSTVPFGGLVDAPGRWPGLTAALIAVLLVLGLLGLAASRAGHDLRWILLAHVALASVMGPLVWERAEGTGRTLLPLGVIGLWAWAEGRVRRSEPAPTATTPEPAVATV